MINPPFVYTTPFVADSQWHHCAVTYSNSSVIVLLDGQVVANSTVTANTTISPVYLGCYWGFVFFNRTRACWLFYVVGFFATNTRAVIGWVHKFSHWLSHLAKMSDDEFILSELSKLMTI
jgi:hypothetical protein